MDTYTFRVKKKDYSHNPWRIVAICPEGKEREVFGRYSGSDVPLAFPTKAAALEYSLDRWAWYHNHARLGLLPCRDDGSWRDRLPTGETP